MSADRTPVIVAAFRRRSPGPAERGAFATSGRRPLRRSCGPARPPTSPEHLIEDIHWGCPPGGRAGYDVARQAASSPGSRSRCRHGQSLQVESAGPEQAAANIIMGLDDIQIAGGVSTDHAPDDGYVASPRYLYRHSAGTLHGADRGAWLQVRDRPGGQDAWALRSHQRAVAADRSPRSCRCGAATTGAEGR